MTQTSNDRLSLAKVRMRFVFERLRTSGGDQEQRQGIKQKLKGLPVSLRSNGLAVVAARLAADNDIYIGDNLLTHWLLRECPLFRGVAPDFDNKNPKIQALVRWCMEMSRLEYEAVQQEALRLMEQSKLIAEALWPEKK